MNKRRISGGSSTRGSEMSEKGMATSEVETD